MNRFTENSGHITSAAWEGWWWEDPAHHFAANDQIQAGAAGVPSVVPGPEAVTPVLPRPAAHSTTAARGPVISSGDSAAASP
jgi:hypothetical protein